MLEQLYYRHTTDTDKQTLYRQILSWLFINSELFLLLFTFRTSSHLKSFHSASLHGEFINDLLSDFIFGCTIYYGVICMLKSKSLVMWSSLEFKRKATPCSFWHLHWQHDLANITSLTKINILSCVWTQQQSMEKGGHQIFQCLSVPSVGKW